MRSDARKRQVVPADLAATLEAEFTHGTCKDCAHWARLHDQHGCRASHDRDPYTLPRICQCKTPQARVHAHNAATRAAAFYGGQT